MPLQLRNKNKNTNNYRRLASPHCILRCLINVLPKPMIPNQFARGSAMVISSTFCQATTQTPTNEEPARLLRGQSSQIKSPIFMSQSPKTLSSSAQLGLQGASLFRHWLPCMEPRGRRVAERCPGRGAERGLSHYGVT